MRVRFNQIAAVNRLAKRYHYSHRGLSEGFVVLALSFHDTGEGLFGDEGPARAGVLFSFPSTRWAEPVIELMRMVCCDNYSGPPLSQLVSLGLKELRRQGEWNLVVSYADPSFDHHGGIYQACSWKYHGRRGKRRDGFQIGKRFVPNRTCSHLYHTQSLPKLKERFRTRSIQIVPHIDPGKHLYWKSLNRRGKAKAQRLGFESNPYPKPNRETE